MGKQIWNIQTRTSGEVVVLEIRTHPDRGRGWFENPKFWQTSSKGYKGALKIVSAFLKKIRHLSFCGGRGQENQQGTPNGNVTLRYWAHLGLPIFIQSPRSNQ